MTTDAHGFFGRKPQAGRDWHPALQPHPRSKVFFCVFCAFSVASVVFCLCNPSFLFQAEQLQSML